MKAAKWWQRIEVVRLLLENGADINAHDKDGETALTKAVKQGNKGVIQLLTSAENP